MDSQISGLAMTIGISLAGKPLKRVLTLRMTLFRVRCEHYHFCSCTGSKAVDFYIELVFTSAKGIRHALNLNTRMLLVCRT